MEFGPYPVPWKCGNVNEEVDRAFGWRDEAEATIVVPLRRGSWVAEGGLTSRAIGTSGREISLAPWLVFDACRARILVKLQRLFTVSPHTAVSPPSTTSSAPVTNELSSDAR